MKMKSDVDQALLDRILEKTLQMLGHRENNNGSSSHFSFNNPPQGEELIAGMLIVLLEWAMTRTWSGRGSLEDGLRDILCKEEQMDDSPEAVIQEMLRKGGMPSSEVLSALENFVAKANTRDKSAGPSVNLIRGEGAE